MRPLSAAPGWQPQVDRDLRYLSFAVEDAVASLCAGAADERFGGEGNRRGRDPLDRARHCRAPSQPERGRQVEWLGLRGLIPKAIRERLGLTPGAAVEVAETDGTVEIRPALVPMALVEVGGRLVAQAPDLPPLTDEIVRETIERTRR